MARPDEVSNLAVEVLCTDSSETVLLGALEVLTPLSAAGSAGKAAVEAAKKLLIHPSRQVPWRCVGRLLKGKLKEASTTSTEPAPPRWVHPADPAAEVAGVGAGGG